MIELLHLPRKIRERWETTKRDLGMISLLLKGLHPPPLIPLLLVKTERALMTPRSLRVTEVRRETDDALTLLLQDPAGLPIPFLPGQFFTVLIPIEGKIERRAYSASRYIPDASRLELTCKRIVGGRVSSYLHEFAHAGMMIQVLGPSVRRDRRLSASLPVCCSTWLLTGLRLLQSPRVRPARILHPCCSDPLIPQSHPRADRLHRWENHRRTW